jgi:hypothetical protein
MTWRIISESRCGRLKNSPELFPSPSSREGFLSKVATLTSTIVIIEEVGGEIVRFLRTSDMRQPLTEEMLERMAKVRERHLWI